MFFSLWQLLLKCDSHSLSVCLSVPGLPLGSDSEAKERPLAGAPHPSSLHRLWQCALWGPATQPAPLHPTGPHAWRPVPHAPGCFPHVRLHRRPRGTNAHQYVTDLVLWMCFNVTFLTLCWQSGQAMFSAVPSPQTYVLFNHHQGPVMPGSHSVERFVIEENLHCIIMTHWKERKTWWVSNVVNECLITCSNVYTFLIFFFF